MFQNLIMTQSFNVILSLAVLLACVIANVNSQTVSNFVPSIGVFDQAGIISHQNILLTGDSINEIAENSEPNICETEKCAEESATMLSYIDNAVQPWLLRLIFLN